MAKKPDAKKVLFISSWFPNRTNPFNGDFVERHALASSLLCITAVLHVSPDPSIHGRFMEIFEIQKNGLFEVIIYFRRINSRFRHYNRLMNNLLYGAAYFIGFWIVRWEIGKPDVIHANVIVPIGRVALFLHKISGIPYIISEHWTIYLSDARKTLPRNQKAVSKAFALVPVTENLKEALISYGYNTRYFVVPNVVNTVLFQPSFRSGENGKKRMLHVSSMKEEHKNINGIIRATARLSEIRDDFILTFLGNATPEQQNLVNEAGLSGYIIFTGEVEHNKVAGFMKQSDFLIMFSNFENLPCVILEALACGLPVISTRVGGIAEWVNEQNGILIDRGDETALMQSMAYLLDHYADYNKELLHQYAVQNFSPEVIAAKFLDIYNQASVKNKK